MTHSTSSGRAQAPRSIDFSVLDELRALQADDEPDIVGEVVALFLSDSPRRVEAIAASVAAKDAVRLGKEAHGLKGSAANVGAAKLRSICEQLERLGKAGQTADAPPLVSALITEYQQVARELSPLATQA